MKYKFNKLRVLLSRLVNPSHETKSEKLDKLIATKAKEICKDRFEGKQLSPQEVVYVAENIKKAVKELLLERANKHAEHATKLQAIAEKENHRANSAITAASILTMLLLTCTTAFADPPEHANNDNENGNGQHNGWSDEDEDNDVPIDDYIVGLGIAAIALGGFIKLKN